VKEKIGETDISAPQDKAQANPWVHGADEHERGPLGFEKAESQRKKTPDRIDGFSGRFTKEDRLRARPEFLEIFSRGKRHNGQGITVLYKANGLGRSRLGLDISKRAGKAPARNRYKRLIREVFRLHRSRLAGNYDLVIRVNPGKGALDYRNILREFLIFAEKTAGWRTN